MLLAAALAAGCDISDGDSGAESASPGSGAAAAGSGPLAFREARALPASYVTGRRVYGLAGAPSPRRLAAPVNAPFTGTFVPPAVPGHGKGVLAYHAFRRGRPVVRLHDAGRDRDAVIAEGAFSIAWRRDGTLAYFKGLRSRVRDPQRFRGHLVVDDLGRRGGGRRWTATPGRYLAAAWAADRLLAYRLSRTGVDVLALDRPRRIRVLARDAFLIAVSPDGSTALVGGAQTAAGTTVRLVDVRTGATVDRFSLRGRRVRGSREPITFVASGGSWSRDRVVGATNLGLVVFKVESSRIALEQVLTVDFTTFQIGIQEPRLDTSGRRIVAWAELTPLPEQPIADAVLLACDRIARRCLQGPPSPGLQPPRPLYNPSRP